MEKECKIMSAEIPKKLYKEWEDIRLPILNYLEKNNADINIVCENEKYYKKVALLEQRRKLKANK
jgi:hypothetical protein